jgi:hypothetical protein
MSGELLILRHAKSAWDVDLHPILTHFDEKKGGKPIGCSTPCGKEFSRPNRQAR